MTADSEGRMGRRPFRGEYSRMSTRVGIIGTGIMGADHAQILQRFVSGAELVLVADNDLNRVERVASQLGCRATSDPLALIDDADVDAVLVASHDSTHAEFLLASVRAGKPVLCEKPLRRRSL